MINDSVKLTGQVDIKVFGPDGVLKDTRFIPNLVVTVGKGFIASLLQNNTFATEMKYMGVGTGTTAPSVGQTDLVTEGLYTRVTTTRTNPSAQVVQYVAAFTGQTQTISEAAIFNNSANGPASGTMLCRTEFTGVPLAPADTLSLQWQITIS